MSAFSGEIANPGTYNDDIRKLVAYGERTSSTTSTTTEAAVLRLDGVKLKAGHRYKIWSTPLWGDTVSANLVGAQVRYSTTDTADASSTVLPGSRSDLRQADSSFPETFTIQTTYAPGASDQELSLALCCIAVTGAAAILEGSSTKVIALVVEDMGSDTGNVGIAL